MIVVAKRKIADAIVEISLGIDPVSQVSDLPDWEPGAHIDLHLANGMVRQYSLFAVEKNSWKIAVLVEESGRGGSLFIDRNLKVGDSLLVTGPRNHFQFDAMNEVNFIAGGIGITPLIPMIEVAQRSSIDWRLYYLGRTKSHMAFVDDLVSKYGHRVELFISDEGKRFNPLSWGATNRANYTTYACGPEKLLSDVRESVKNPQDLHEEFFAPKHENFAPNRSFLVYATKSQVEFEVPEDESILVAADFEGIEIEGDCLEGTCGSCETRIVDGDVEHRDSILTQEQKASGQTMMICVSRAKSARISLEL